MKTIKNMFRSSLVDKYVELSMKESEREEFMSSLVNEIRSELEGQSEGDKLTSYSKIFLVMDNIYEAHQREPERPLGQLLHSSSHLFCDIRGKATGICAGYTDPQR